MLLDSTPGLNNSQAHTWPPRVAREGAGHSLSRAGAGEGWGGGATSNFLAATIECFPDEPAKYDTAYIGRFVRSMTTLWWAEELHRSQCPTLQMMPGAETVSGTETYAIMRANVPDCEPVM